MVICGAGGGFGRGCTRREEGFVYSAYPERGTRWQVGEGEGEGREGGEGGGIGSVGGRPCEIDCGSVGVGCRGAWSGCAKSARGSVPG